MKKRRPDENLTAEPFEAIIQDGLFKLQAPVVRISGFKRLQPVFIRMSDNRHVEPISVEPMCAYRAEKHCAAQIAKIARNWGATCPASIEIAMVNRALERLPE